MTAAKLVIGNWKTNGSAAGLSAFADGVTRDWPGCEAALCVPHALQPAAQAAARGGSDDACAPRAVASDETA